MPLRIPEKKNESKEKAKTSDDYSMHTLNNIYQEIQKYNYDDVIREAKELRELLDKPVVSLEDEIKKWAQ